MLPMTLRRCRRRRCCRRCCRCCCCSRPRELPSHGRQTGHKVLVVQGLEQELVEVCRRRGRRHFCCFDEGFFFHQHYPPLLRPLFFFFPEATGPPSRREERAPSMYAPAQAEAPREEERRPGEEGSAKKARLPKEGKEKK